MTRAAFIHCRSMSFSITWYLYKCGRSVLDKMLEQRAVVHNLKALKKNRNSLPHISGSLPALASENLYLTGVPWDGDAGGTWFILPEILLWITANKSMGSRGNCTSLNHGSPLRHRVSLVRQLNLSKPQCLHLWNVRTARVSSILVRIFKRIVQYLIYLEIHTHTHGEAEKGRNFPYCTTKSKCSRTVSCWY